MVAEDTLAKTQQVEALRRQEPDQYFQPATDVKETEQEVILTLDMPGVGKNNVEVTVDKGTLTVIGRVGNEEQGEAIYRETRIGNYRREFTLSKDLDTGKISGEVKDGVLTVRIGKPEVAKPKQIEIKSS